VGEWAASPAAQVKFWLGGACGTGQSMMSSDVYFIMEEKSVIF